MADTPAWQPTATRDNLVKRAAVLAQIRQFFAARDVLEVETPQLCSAAVTDVNLNSVPAAEGFLHTSPEFAMKRLLAAGSHDIYQLCKVFRQGEQGRHHNREFTLLEWYRCGWGYQQLMAEVAQLLSAIIAPSREPLYISYRDAFQTTVGLDPFTATAPELNTALQRADMHTNEYLPHDEALDALAGLSVYPALAHHRLVFVYDFPRAQASLARLRADDPSIAERFEVLFNGIELGNGFSELTDATEQAQRFQDDIRQRRQKGLTAITPDTRFLAALEAGLPAAAGVAVGIDRLVMLACNAHSIADVMTFTTENA